MTKTKGLAVGFMLAIIAAGMMACSDVNNVPAQKAAQASVEAGKAQPSTATLLGGDDLVAPPTSKPLELKGVSDKPRNGFGYDLGQLIYDRWFEPVKTVDMTVTTSTFTVDCPKPLELPKFGSAKLRITFVGAYSPSKLWEREFHREVALWDKGTNTVSKAEVKQGVEMILAQYRDLVCMAAHKKSPAEIFRDPTLPAIGSTPFVEHFGARMKREQPEWDMRMHSILIDPDKDALMRIAAEVLRPVPPIAKPAQKKPAVPKVAPKPPCGCAQTT